MHINFAWVDPKISDDGLEIAEQSILWQIDSKFLLEWISTLLPVVRLKLDYDDDDEDDDNYYDHDVAD